MVVAVIVALFVVAGTGAAVAQEADPPKALELLGVGAATIFPFDGDYDAYGAVGFTLQALPIAEPEHLTLATTTQYLAANLALDVLWSSASMDDASVGVSLRLYDNGTRVPVRLGIIRPSGVGWSGYAKLDVPLG
jgi:hypothetical protein